MSEFIPRVPPVVPEVAAAPEKGAGMLAKAPIGPKPHAAPIGPRETVVVGAPSKSEPPKVNPPKPPVVRPVKKEYAYQVNARMRAAERKKLTNG